MFNDLWDTSGLEQAQTEDGRVLDGMETADGRKIGDVPRVIPWKFWTPDGKPCTIGRWAEILERKSETIDGDEEGEEAVDGWTRIGSDHVGDVWISTVWLGLNHSYLGDGPPIIFETMVFGGNLDQEQWRYSTPEQARAGHAAAVTLVQLDERATEHRVDLIRGVAFLAIVAAVLAIVMMLR
jgi:hypothetical protein